MKDYGLKVKDRKGTILKSCPFCGKNEAYLTKNCYGENYVRCPNCGAVVWGNDKESLTEKRAVELWNTRINETN